MQSARPWLVVLTVTLAVALASAGEAIAQARQPNIVVIVGDDMGYGDIGVHGCKDIPTPNIDALAGAGVRARTATCRALLQPTRAGLMTGRYQQRFGHEFNMGPDAGPDGGLPLTETTMANRLKAAGYRTALVGKWHLGSPGASSAAARVRRVLRLSRRRHPTSSSPKG